MGTMESLKSWRERNPEATDDWRMLSGNGNRPTVMDEDDDIFDRIAQADDRRAAEEANRYRYTPSEQEARRAAELVADHGEAIAPTRAQAIDAYMDESPAMQDNQYGLMCHLLRELDRHNPDVAHEARTWIEAHKAEITKRRASDLITRLRGHLARPAMPANRPEGVAEAPQKPAAGRTAFDPYNDIPTARYALVDAKDANTIHFYHVTHKEYNGRDFIYVDERASDTRWPVKAWPRKKAILDAIRAAGPREAALLFGREIGACCRCGRSLTDADSRAAGIGPDCAGKDW